MNNDDLFNYLVATDELDKFLGLKEDNDNDDNKEDIEIDDEDEMEDEEE